VQFVEVGTLRDEPLGAQAEDVVHDLGAGGHGQDEYRDLRKPLAQFRQHVHAIPIRQVEVQQEEVGLLPRDGIDDKGAVEDRADDLVVFPQHPADALEDHHMVLGPEELPGLGVSLGHSCPRAPAPLPGHGSRCRAATRHRSSRQPGRRARAWR
jgi:hypothetical protein